MDAAVDLAGRLGADGWLIGGGQDSYDWLKNRTKRTTAVVDLSESRRSRAFATMKVASKSVR